MAASHSRRPVVAGNWKASSNREKVEAAMQRLNAEGALRPNVDVLIFPPALQADFVRKEVPAGVSVGVQNIHTEGEFGAFTGALTAPLVRDWGVHWTLVGHSERRSLFGETDAIVTQKVATALKEGLSVIVCVGETLEDREADRTDDVIRTQLDAAGAGVGADQWDRVIIAYEPVWAIGTGRVATVEQVQTVHSNIRAWLETNHGEEVARTTRILYGGSVKAANVEDLLGAGDVDGFLVGGASLKSDFIDIIHATSSKRR